MSPLEARPILEALARGIDPETGEILPEPGVLHSPQVIRALFIAAQALDGDAGRGKPAKPLPGNAGRAWSSEEDEELLARFDAGIPVKELAEKHARSRGAIHSRLLRLGRLQERGAPQSANA
ncbi:hypothetical protein GCM10027082_38570 [Comamonas humi]